MRELYFYPAVKNEKYEPILFNGEGKPQIIYWNSQSFIDIPAFTESKMSLIKEDIKEPYREHFKDIGGQLFLYPFTLQELDMMSERGNCGLVNGYAGKEDAAIYYSLDRFERRDFFHWEMERLLPAEYVLSLPVEEQKKYVPLTHLDTYSAAYTANLLSEILARFCEPNACVLVDYSF